MTFREQTYSVLLVSSAEKLNDSILALLPGTDYYPVTVVRSDSAARRRLLEQEFDLVIVNAPLPDEFGARLAMDACQDTQSGVLLLVKREIYDEVYDQALLSGVVVLAKPTSAQLVGQSLRALCAIRERLRRREERTATLEEKVTQLRLVNRAKWLLIEREGLTEPEAHRQIEKTAMDRRLPKDQIAREIIGRYAASASEQS
ncbi:MAG: ANTAR domain-containing protein [Oscillospiraceae bacterium]|nr:ANTAR domain-containing protein [Oscillospiraceae bacterium]